MFWKEEGWHWNQSNRRFVHTISADTTAIGRKFNPRSNNKQVRGERHRHASYKIWIFDLVTTGRTMYWVVWCEHGVAPQETLTAPPPPLTPPMTIQPRSPPPERIVRGGTLMRAASAHRPLILPLLPPTGVAAAAADTKYVDTVPSIEEMELWRELHAILEIY